MKNKTLGILACFLFLSCKDKKEKVLPQVSSITESIYASGLVKSKNQYQVYATANGIIGTVFVSEGDTVKNGSPILFISNQAQKLSRENAELTAAFNDLNANQGKLEDARQSVELARNKMKIDSSLFYRQNSLWQQQIGTKVELEQKELAYQNSKTNYSSALIKFEDLKRQLAFSASQSKKNLAISSTLENDFLIKSEIDGIVYDLFKSKGELVSPQTPLAIIGDARKFVLEMQVDEYDIFKIRKALKVIVSLDSYKGKTFEALVTKIYPIMNERSKTSIVEAEFVIPPQRLFPNITFEANIIVQTKDLALLIPRNCLVNDSIVIKSSGDTTKVRTGLKDLHKVEILSGLAESDELLVPKR